jgi:acyl carrier protein
VSRDRQIIAAEENIREKDFWVTKLSGEPVITHFPYGKTKTRDEKSPLETVTFRLEGPLYMEIMKVGSDSDYKLHIILGAVVAVLLAQYTGEGNENRDVLIVSPVYKPAIEGEFLNTLLPLRIPQYPGMAFKEILKETSRSVIEAINHQNYPVEVLFDHFAGPEQDPGVTVPEVAVLLENIHERRHILHMIPTMIFSFHRGQAVLDGKLEYNCTVHEKTQAESVVSHLIRLLEAAAFNLETPVSSFNIVSVEEKKRWMMNIEAEPGETKTVSAPMNMMEEKLAVIWAEVLELEKNDIDADANFFQLNGNSLRTIMLISRIFKEFNVRVTLADVFKYPTVRELTRKIDGAAGIKYKSIEPVKEKEYYFLSSAQKRLFFIQQLDVGGDAYNVPDAIELDFSLDLERLRNAVRAMIDRHESFRTSFEIVGDEPMQKVHPPHEVEFDIEYYESSKDEVAEIVKNFVRPFDLGRPPLWRTGILQVGQSTYLMYDIHHVVTDAFSKGIFFKDLIKLYNGEVLPPLKLQYKDYAEWQNSESQKEAMQLREKYWLNLFSGDLPVLRLPTDYERPPVSAFEGNSVSFRIEPGELDALYHLTQTEGVTIFMLLLGIYTVMLSKISGQTDIILGTVIAGRSHADLEEIVGMFVNTLALRNYPRPGKSFADYLNDVKTNTLEAFENQDYQFEDLVDKLTLGRDISRNALFDVLLVVGNIDLRSKEKEENILPPIKQKTVGYQNRTSKFDMTLFYHEDLELFELEYSTQLFEQETIKEFIGYFREVAALVARDPFIKIKDINITHRLKESIAEFPQMEFEF